MKYTVFGTEVPQLYFSAFTNASLFFLCFSVQYTQVDEGPGTQSNCQTNMYFFCENIDLSVLFGQINGAENVL